MRSSRKIREDLNSLDMRTGGGYGRLGPPVGPGKEWSAAPLYPYTETPTEIDEDPMWSSIGDSDRFERMIGDRSAGSTGDSTFQHGELDSSTSGKTRFTMESMSQQGYPVSQYRVGPTVKSGDSRGWSSPSILDLDSISVDRMWDIVEPDERAVDRAQRSVDRIFDYTHDEDDEHSF